VLGFHNEVLASRLFKVISSKCTTYLADRLSGIEFFEFINELKEYLFSHDARRQSLFIFRLYDVDGDGLLSPIDLLTFVNAVTVSSSLGYELKIIRNYIVT
jgi:Ca2+-binding EF-hand superfamily protein